MAKDRRTALEKLLGVRVAAEVDKTVQALDAQLEAAGVEHKALDEEQAGQLADLIIEMMADPERSPEDKRAALVQMLTELSMSEAPEAEAAGEEGEEDEEAPMPEPEAKSEKQADMVLKMIEDMAELVEAQDALTDVLTRTNAKVADVPARLDKIEAQLAALTKLTAGKPRIASVARETLVSDAEKAAADAQDETYEIHPVLGVKVRTSR